MPFARRYTDSPYAITKTAATTAVPTPVDIAVRIDQILGAAVITTTTARLFTDAGQIDVTATALEVLAVIDPQPTAPIVTPPAASDPTGGKLRINPQGGAIAFEQNSSKGKWLVIFTSGSNEVNYLYTDDTKNPEIAASWPFLKKA